MARTSCPQCDKKGQSLDNATVKSLISVSLHRVKNTPYLFCEAAKCDVVYFAEDHSEIFYKHEVRERIYQKEPDAKDVLVCYCFSHTLDDVIQSMDSEGNSAVVDDIKWGIQQGHCACDWRNPQGKCCLGNVTELVKNNNS